MAQAPHPFPCRTCRTGPHRRAPRRAALVRGPPEAHARALLEKRGVEQPRLQRHSQSTPLAHVRVGGRSYVFLLACRCAAAGCSCGQWCSPSQAAARATHGALPHTVHLPLGALLIWRTACGTGGCYLIALIFALKFGEQEMQTMALSWAISFTLCTPRPHTSALPIHSAPSLGAPLIPCIWCGTGAR